MDYQGILNVIEDKIQGEKLQGNVASYIPELAKIKPGKLGMHLTSVIGEEFHFGDSEERFSIQSISKVFSLTLALLKEKDEIIWERVDVEPSGDPFNSLVQLEYENGIPRNPLINSGALVICDILVSHLDNPKKEYLEFVRRIAGNATIDYNERVAASEKEEGFNNRAMINLMKGYGNIHNDVEEVLDFYFDTCSISMSCRELAQTFVMYANQGKLLKDQKRVLSEVHTKRINAIMQTCGFYDEAGEFSFRVGLPGKSGVGGGIVAVYPNMYSVAVWSPKLNEKGNSTAGMRALELLTEITGSSIF
ncbi:L-glutaminase [Ekhidna lutea]|uniref:Glutaminase n=1 Tax=Ekhidna lutea TaxID=447679 RepID=A0A239HXD2_EKHLU|nr:glutaminase [Ekhidna lutea]SNS85728.1 L-glutaminase [Ekhidna lutea]